MRPTISNAFTLGTPSADSTPRRGTRNRMRRRAGMENAAEKPAPDPLSVLLAPMQADLREATFGFSLELNPIQAVDAVHALVRNSPESAQFLLSMEQSAWRDGNTDASLSVVADRFGIMPLEVISPDQLVLDAIGLASLAAVLQPTRLLVVGVDGPIESSDARAITRAIEAGASPLTADVRAFAALEVIGDRSSVLHTTMRPAALDMVAQNFRHYLAATLDRNADSFAAPDPVVMERLIGVSGALTVRPIETRVQGDSIDIGVNTSIERFTQPANLSLVYDCPSNSWHAE